MLVAEEDFGSDPEHVRILQAIEQGPQKARLDLHVVVQEHQHVARRNVHAGLVAADEVAILGQRHDLDPRVLLLEPLDGSVGAAVVDDDDLVVAAMLFDRELQRRQQHF